MDGRTGALDPPGKTWRDRPAIDRGDGVYLAGDMVAAPGCLSEIAWASAIEAAGWPSRPLDEPAAGARRLMSTVTCRAGSAPRSRGPPRASASCSSPPAQAEIGIWGLVAPHSFFSNYPGFGHHWVSALGLYNEHLVRDYAAAELGLRGAAACGRDLVRAPARARRRRRVPRSDAPPLRLPPDHDRDLSTRDNIASLGGFVLEIVVVAGRW